MPPNINVGNNNSIDSSQLHIHQDAKQIDEVCFYIDKNSKCLNHFQEKCNNCQFMFCKKHLFVQERLFYCDNCISISKVRREVNNSHIECLKCRDMTFFCCCIGYCVYCCVIQSKLENWSTTAHNKHKIACKSQADCYGFSVLCGLVNIPCPGHGASIDANEQESITLSTKRKKEDEEIEEAIKKQKRANLLKGLQTNEIQAPEETYEKDIMQNQKQVSNNTSEILKQFNESDIAKNLDKNANINYGEGNSLITKKGGQVNTGVNNTIKDPLIKED